MEQKNTAVAVKHSSIEGDGVFAARPFLKGDQIATIKGQLYPLALLPRKMWRWAIQIGEDVFSVPARLTTWDYVNHSCCPNAGIRMEGDVEHLIALQTIRYAEEITIDYSTYVGPNWSWSMKCACGRGCCRGIIAKFTLLPCALQRKYIRLGVVPEFLKPQLTSFQGRQHPGAAILSSKAS